MISHPHVINADWPLLHTNRERDQHATKRIYQVHIPTGSRFPFRRVHPWLRPIF